MEVRKIGRLNYIDPANIDFENNEIIRGDRNIFNPLEDYCIAVDLIVELQDRASCGVASKTGENYTLTYSTSNDSMSFFYGTSGVNSTNLTTNYTDIDLRNPSYNTNECLGIENITIEYDSWFYPRVTIKFIDVRGASVFSENEYNFQNNKQVNGVNLYHSFFTFPYPLFKLDVKGFYGIGARYYLTIEDISLKFDSSSGNFEITAKFIGMMYRIYTDIPMVYACISPFMEIGGKHWKECVENGKFSFSDGRPMITYIELARRVLNAKYDQRTMNLTNEEDKARSDVDTKINTLNDIKDGNIRNNQNAQIANGYIYIVSDENNFSDYKKTISEYIKEVESYENGKFLEYCESLKTYANGNPLATVKITDKGEPANTSDKEAVEKYKIPLLKQFTSKYYVFVLKDDVKTQEELRSAIDEELKRLDKEKNEIVEHYKKESEKLLEQLIDFKPTIKNMFNLMFAHMDTFIYSFNNTLRRIKDEIDGGTSRNLTNFNTNYSDVNRKLDVLPPFPGLYGDEIENQKKKMVEKWLEDIPNGADLYEVDFVKDLLNAACFFINDITEIEKTREEYEKAAEEAASGETEGQVASVAITPINIPLTNYDLYQTNLAYSNIKNVIVSEDNNSINYLLERFAHRAYYFILANSDKKIDIDILKAFGICEAINCYNEIRTPNSNSLIGLKNLMDASSFVNLLTSQIWCDLSENFFHKKQENGQKLFLKKGEGEDATLESYLSAWGCRPIPINGASFNQVINDMMTKKENLKDKPNLLVLIPDSGAQSTSNSYHIGDYNSILETKCNAIASTIDACEKLSDNKKSIAKKITKSRVFKRIADKTSDSEFLVRGTNLTFDCGNGGYGGCDFTRLFCTENKKPLHSTTKNIIKSAIRRTISLQNQDKEYRVNYFLRYFLEESLKSNKNTFDNAYCSKLVNHMTTGVHSLFLLLCVGNICRYSPQGCGVQSYMDKTKKIVSYTNKWIKSNAKQWYDLIKYNNSDDLDKHTDELLTKLGDLILTPIEICDYYDNVCFINSEDSNFSMRTNYRVNLNYMTTVYDSFRSAMSELYSDVVEKVTNTEYKTQEQRDIENALSQKDVKLSTYLTLKTLYDKWLSAPYNGENTWVYGSKDSDFSNFEYIDSLFHDIGDDLLTNVSDINDFVTSCIPSSNTDGDGNLGSIKKTSVFEYLAKIAQDTGGVLMSFPQKIGQQNSETLKNMFKAIPYLSNEWRNDSSSFVYVYKYKPSEHMENGQFADDGINLMSQEAEEIFGDDNGYEVPAFGVTFAKQNQSFFKNLSLSTENTQVTEASISATGNIAAKGSSSPRESTLFGQDLYRVQTSYSYQCEFDMMGNIQVMPLMIFQLNNVPFWRGAYMIYKVTHNITQGDMTTHVCGMRINRYALPMADGVITLKNTYNSRGSNSRGISIPDEFVEVPNGLDIDKEYFDGKNVSKTNPLICLTPAHGPNVKNHTAEWYWSQMIVDKLAAKFSMTKGYNVQTCNKGGAHTTTSTYEMTQVEDLVKKYGKDCVISVTPHWYLGTGRKAAIYYGGVNENNQIVSNNKSKKLAEVFQKTLINFIKDNTKHKKSTPNMMFEYTNPQAAEIRTIQKIENLDKAVLLDCPCVAPMFWYDGYPQDKICNRALTRTALQETTAYKDVNSNGEFLLSQGWLMDDEGQNAVVNICYDAITKYISDLKNE